MEVSTLNFFVSDQSGNGRSVASSDRRNAALEIRAQRCHNIDELSADIGLCARGCTAASHRMTIEDIATTRWPVYIAAFQSNGSTAHAEKSHSKEYMYRLFYKLCNTGHGGSDWLKSALDAKAEGLT